MDCHPLVSFQEACVNDSVCRGSSWGDRTIDITSEQYAVLLVGTVSGGLGLWSYASRHCLRTSQEDVLRTEIGIPGKAAKHLAIAAGYMAGDLLQFMGVDSLGKAWQAARALRAAEGAVVVAKSGGEKALEYGSNLTKTDVYHNFPYSFDKTVISQGTKTVVSDSYSVYSQAGAVNGVSGTYEVGVNQAGVITHRMFRPY